MSRFHAALSSIRESMIARCHRQSHTRYAYYGAKGIRVCDEWRSSPDAFFRWARQTGYCVGMEIDRRDNTGDYCPENCRWASRSENLANRRKFYTKPGSAGSSRFIGVRQQGQSWTVRIRVDGRNRYVGSFASEEDAARAYDAAAAVVHGEFAMFNFPPSPALPCSSEMSQ